MTDNQHIAKIPAYARFSDLFKKEILRGKKWIDWRSGRLVVRSPAAWLEKLANPPQKTTNKR